MSQNQHIPRAQWTHHCEEFDNHHLVSFFYDEHTQLKGFIAIHRKNPRMPSFGATRLWCYDRAELDALNDVLRLSKMMSYKAALAGLPCGGAKAVIIAPEKMKNRTELFKRYARAVRSLGGSFVTGTDVGLERSDIEIMRKKTDAVVGLRVDPTKYTALGIYESIQLCLKETYGSEAIAGHTFAVQGAGKIGSAIVALLARDGAHITVTDIDPVKARKLQREFPNVKAVTNGEIYEQPAEVFVPCALSHAVTKNHIRALQSRIVVGGANNQLDHPETGQLLHDRGILYAPDYVVNAGGVIAVFDEYQNPRMSAKRIEDKVHNIRKTLRTIFNKSRRTKRATNLIADEMARDVFERYE